jgi:RNA polymerase sigma-70 factor (ECF subfamily)
MTVAAIDPPAPSEAEWLDRCRAGDPAAWRWLYHRHFPHVFRLAMRLGASEREAADVCQEVFIRAYRGLGGFRGGAAVGTWLFRITFNEVARLKRAGALRRALAAVLLRGRAPAIAAAPPPDEAVEQSEAFRELEGTLGRMKPKLRAAFVLHELEELPLAEIAEVLGCGTETVKSRLRHARAEFRRLRRQRALASLAGGKR